MRLRIVIALVVALALGGVATFSTSTAVVTKLPSALAPPAPDPPTEVQRLQIENDMKQLQLFQAQVQIINAQFDQTKAALQAKLKALERPGYDLDLQTWRYVPKGAK